MALVTQDEVKVIIDTGLTDLTPFIAAAHIIVSEDLSNKGFTNRRLTEIERWLAAHFVAMREDKARLTGVETGDSQYTFGGELGEDLKFTRYGQQALILDTSGTLAAKGMVTSRLTVNG